MGTLFIKLWKLLYMRLVLEKKKISDYQNKLPSPLEITCFDISEG